MQIGLTPQGKSDIYAGVFAHYWPRIHPDNHIFRHTKRKQTYAAKNIGA